MRISRRLFTHASTVALLGALGSMGMTGTASANLIQSCPGQTGMSQTSAVLSHTQQMGPNLFSYNFRVCNTSGGYEGGTELIRDWELPLIPGAGVTNIVAPFLEGWTVSIETIGVRNDATGWEGDAEWRNEPQWNAFDGITQVIHWYTGECFRFEQGSQLQCGGGNPIFPGNGLGELDPMSNTGFRFGFEANFGAGAAPYQASWIDLPPRTGDPDDPVFLAPLLRTVPEPGGLALFAIALGAMMAARRKRKQTPDVE